MKIWLGPELEGTDKHIKTLFVKGETIDGQQVLEILMLQKGIKRLYLGAGRTDVKNLINEITLVSYCVKNEIKIVTECSIGNLYNLPYSLYSTDIIVRIDCELLEELMMTDKIKIDTGSNVYIKELGQMIHTSLKDLDGDIFKQDTVIYNDEED